MFWVGEIDWGFIFHLKPDERLTLAYAQLALHFWRFICRLQESSALDSLPSLSQCSDSFFFFLIFLFHLRWRSSSLNLPVAIPGVDCLFNWPNAFNYCGCNCTIEHCSINRRFWFDSHTNSHIVLGRVC